jgi:hypothetical protein
MFVTLVTISNNVAAWLWLCEPVVGQSTLTARLRAVWAVTATWGMSSLLFVLTRGTLLGWLGGARNVGTDALVVLVVAMLFAGYRSIRRFEAAVA